MQSRNERQFLLLLFLLQLGRRGEGVVPVVLGVGLSPMVLRDLDTDLFLPCLLLAGVADGDLLLVDVLVEGFLLLGGVLDEGDLLLGGVLAAVPLLVLCCQS